MRQDCCCVIRSSRATLVNRQSRGRLERGGGKHGNKSTQIEKTQFWVSFLPTVSRRLILSLESCGYSRRSSHDAASQTLPEKTITFPPPLFSPLSNLFSQITLPFLTNPSSSKLPHLRAFGKACRCENPQVLNKISSLEHLYHFVNDCSSNINVLHQALKEISFSR